MGFWETQVFENRHVGIGGSDQSPDADLFADAISTESGFNVCDAVARGKVCIALNLKYFSVFPENMCLCHGIDTIWILAKKILFYYSRNTRCFMYIPRAMENNLL